MNRSHTEFACRYHALVIVIRSLHLSEPGKITNNGKGDADILSFAHCRGNLKFSGVTVTHTPHTLEDLKCIKPANSTVSTQATTKDLKRTAECMWLRRLIDGLVLVSHR